MSHFKGIERDNKANDIRKVLSKMYFRFMKNHRYVCDFEWKGNKGKGTESYEAYERDFSIAIANKPDINGSSDPNFRGDPSKHNPEDLFLSSICSCHALWYFHLCAAKGVVVISYRDTATGQMNEKQDGSGQFVQVNLNPIVQIKNEKNIQLAIALHHEANKMCFIANSCNFPIEHKAKVVV